MICQNAQDVVISKAQKCPAIKAQCFGCKKIGYYQHMCFKTVKTNCNLLECEDGDSNNQDIDDKIFLGTLIAEQCPDNCVDLNQVDTLSTQKNNKVLIQTHLTAKPYHKHTTPVAVKLTLVLR